MSNFNYLPKYYNKFISFRTNQELQNIKNNITIINNFKKKMNNKIKNNLKKFYNKEYTNLFINIYKYVLELKYKINKYNDKPINFNQLYQFSKNFPLKYIIIETEDKANNIKFDDNLINKKFKINYSFPFIEYVLNDIIEEHDFNNKIDIKDLSGSAFGSVLEQKIRKYIKQLNSSIEIRKVWALNLISENVKKNKLKEIENKTLNSTRYKDLEDIYQSKPLKNSNYYYFYPENQDNYLLDSLLIIKNDDDTFSIIVFQITKYKDKNDLKSKNIYINHIIKNVKSKFKELYNININDIYFWFILNSENLDNNDTCKYLQQQKINYIFYSVNNECLYEERNRNKICDLLFFKKNKALIDSQNFDYYNDEDINNIKIEPLSISKFEGILYELSEKYEIINYENVRKFYFRNNYGLKMDNKLKNSIVETIKAINHKNDNFYILFLFSFPFVDLYKYYNFEDNLMLIFKYKDIIYLNYKKYFYEIDYKNIKLKYFKKIPIQIDLEDFVNLKNDINYNEKEINISEIKDSKETNFIYLYKIYLIDESKN